MRVAQPANPGDPFANLPEARGGCWGEGLTAEKMKGYVWVRAILHSRDGFTGKQQILVFLAYPTPGGGTVRAASQKTLASFY